MGNTVRVYTAELIGTFCLVALTGSVACSASLTPEGGLPHVYLWAIALANGCALAVLLTLTVPLSEGCLNPAITLMLWVCRRLDGWRAAFLILTQLAGSLLAGLALRFVYPEAALIQSRLGTPHLGAALLGEGDAVTWASLFTGVGVEAFLTFVLTLVLFYTLLDGRTARHGGLFAGLTQALLTLAAFYLTGAAANPARWFGPAVWQQTVEPLKAAAPFADHTVYWVGPILGALLGGLLYTTVISPAGKPSEAGS